MVQNASQKFKKTAIRLSHSWAGTGICYTKSGRSGVNLKKRECNFYFDDIRRLKAYMHSIIMVIPKTFQNRGKKKSSHFRNYFIFMW
ncbi:MAG TPA: hypothetical protein DEQ93_06055 [Odoribacter splanchnicus]|nr:hypothetical protein [Odoribacter splanchnicus]